MFFDEIEPVVEMAENTGAFVIDNDSKADWAIEKVLEREAECDRLLALVSEKEAALKERRAEIEKARENGTSYLKGLLRAYFESVKPSSITKTQSSYQLVSGKLVMKKQQPEYVRDEPAMIAWADENAADFVRVEKRINWADLKKKLTVNGEQAVFSDTGEIVPGICVVDRPDVFEVKHG